jgi:hypothetical protein
MGWDAIPSCRKSPDCMNIVPAEPFLPLLNKEWLQKAGQLVWEQRTMREGTRFSG